MIFIYGKWNDFCKKLKQNNIYSIPAKQVFGYDRNSKYLVLKHDVETNVKKAYELSCIENRYGHCGSYYVQAYLLNNRKNIELLKKMQEMGHEISYHYDVMDSCKGDIDSAGIEFEKNKQIFANNGFDILTVCQHGNPVVERIGYTSNRDFFRNPAIRKKYPEISDIMVNFKENAKTDYVYYSDAGRKFKMIFDPLYNDIIKSDGKNIEYKDLDTLLLEGKIGKENVIISTHPHRWETSIIVYLLKSLSFKILKSTAKIVMKVPIFKKIMSKYYFLAKKI